MKACEAVDILKAQFSNLGEKDPRNVAIRAIEDELRSAASPEDYPYPVADMEKSADQWVSAWHTWSRSEVWLRMKDGILRHGKLTDPILSCMSVFCHGYNRGVVDSRKEEGDEQA